MHNAAQALFCPPDALQAFGERAWVAAMLRFEAALARAQAECGVIPAQAADAIEAACPLLANLQVVSEGVAHASMAVPLVEALRTAVGNQHAHWVHLGATSQDAIDTAQALLTQPVLATLLANAQHLQAALLALAREHARTPMLARTLMQSASVTSFGFKCLGWAGAVGRGVDRLSSGPGLRLQLAGAVGTSAQLRAASSGQPGAVARIHAHMANALGLGVASHPWHTQRDEWLVLAQNLALLAGSLGKLATDWALMAQFEVGELTLGAGGSSAMAHKRNPVACVLARAVALRAPHQLAVMLSAMSQEHERALGGWQAELAEWPSLLCGVAASVSAMSQAAKSVLVHPQRMMANLDAMRQTLDPNTADTWFDINLANDAAEQTWQALAQPGTAT